MEYILLIIGFVLLIAMSILVLAFAWRGENKRLSAGMDASC
jgi:hypothetical protein